jgi:hypothetical protein
MSQTSNEFSLIECIKNNGITVGIGIYLIVMAYFLTKDPDALFTKKYIYIALTAMPLFIGLMLTLKNPRFLIDMDKRTIFVVIIGIMAAFYLFNTLTASAAFFVSSLLQLITILIIIVALAIFYKLTYNRLYSMNEGLTGIIINLIFYIPCLLLDFLQYINNDLKQAPKAVYVLLVLEAILALLYIYVPKIQTSIAKAASLKDGVPVVKEPIRLDNVSNLASYVEMQTVKPKPDDIINNKYAISSWIYVVPLPPSTSPYNRDAVIYEFKDYHPALMFNGSTNKFKCYFNRSVSKEFTMPLQKWNHVVTNYTKSGVDLFINGSLVHTVPRDAQNEGLAMGDIIVVGEDAGLSGGVCNMVYFSRPLLKPEIESIYNLNKDREPPIPI